MFVEGLKQGLKYTGSVAERTFGIDAYKRLPGHLHSFNDTLSAKRINRVAALLAQVIFPGTTDHILKSTPDNQYNISFALTGIGRGAIDSACWFSLIPAVVHSPVEFVLYKLAANVITQVGSDVLEAGAKRFRGFRPPAAATLAV